MEDPSTYRRGLNIADSVAMAASATGRAALRPWSNGPTPTPLSSRTASGRAGAVRSIVATSDVRAQARYYAAGMVARLPTSTLAGRLGVAGAAGYLAAVQIDDAQTFHDQRPIEH